jgi:hypothetical protein
MKSRGVLAVAASMLLCVAGGCSRRLGEIQGSMDSRVDAEAGSSRAMDGSVMPASTVPLDASAADRPGFGSHYPASAPDGCECVWPLLTECFPPLSDPCVIEDSDAGVSRCYASGARSLLVPTRGMMPTTEVLRRTDGTVCMYIVFSNTGIQYFDGMGRDVALIRRMASGRWDLECGGGVRSFMTNGIEIPCTEKGFPRMLCRAGSCQP